MFFQRTLSFIALPLMAATVISCTGTNNPQLAMCQALVKELSGSGVSKWDNVSERETERMRTVSVKFTSEVGAKGTIDCNYPRHEGGTTDTAPESVVLNGSKVDRKTLLVSGGRVSNQMLTAAAELTALKTENLARDAAQQAGELANEALNTAKDAAQSLQQK